MAEIEIMKAELEEQEAHPALTLRAKVLEKDLPEHVVKCFGIIKAYMSKHGAKLNGYPYIAYYNINLDNLRGGGTWDMEIGFPVSIILSGINEIKMSETQAAKTISCFYKGPYQGLGKAYSLLTEFIGENNLHFLNISYEYFYNSPENVPEDELLTKLVFLIK
jgi:effector-binding domain-containing protein